MKRPKNDWLKYAKLDLDAALKLLESEHLTQAAAFHCQQAVEKSFKAVLEYKEQRIPRIHDLEKLYGLLEQQGVSIDFDADVLDMINDVYIEFRYPSDMGLMPEGIPKKSTVQKLYNTAEDLYNQVRKILL